MKLWLSILLVIFAIGAAKADVPYAVIDSGNNAYSKEKYDKAIGYYQKFEESGYQSEQVYFNMGNCYYRQGEIAKAILYYEKAKKLNPSDADVQFNLQLANMKTTDKVTTDTPIFLVTWWHNFVNGFSEKGWSIICIAFLFLAALLLVLYSLSGNLVVRQLGFWGGMLMTVFSICSFGFAREQYDMLTSHDTGVIMTASVTVKGAPDDKATQLFVIHEGTKVSIVKTEGDWTEIKLNNSVQGWLKTSDVSPI